MEKKDKSPASLKNAPCRANSVQRRFYLASLVLQTQALLLLRFQRDLFVLVALDSGSDLHGGLAQSGLLVSEESFFSAGGAFGAVESFKAASQAGVAQSAVATAITGELVEHARYLRRLLIGMHLPWVPEIVAAKLSATQELEAGN